MISGSDAIAVMQNVSRRMAMGNEFKAMFIFRGWGRGVFEVCS